MSQAAGVLILGSVSLPGVAFVIACLLVMWVWPTRVAIRIGKRKGRRGWLYVVVGWFTVSTWIGVLILHLLSPRAGFSGEKGTPLFIRPSADKVVFRDDPPKAAAYVPPKRCTACRGLVPQEAPVCGHCGRSFAALTT